MTLHLDAQQYYRAGGRIEWARELAAEGLAAMDNCEYAAAAKLFKESADAYPHPTTLRRAGICLLLDRRPADAVLYLAAAVELSNPSRRTRPRLLLAKALLIAGNKARCVRLLKITLNIFPDVVRAGAAGEFKGKSDLIRLHSLIDELLALIPIEQDTSGAVKDPPISYRHLLAIYR